MVSKTDFILEKDEEDLKRKLLNVVRHPDKTKCMLSWVFIYSPSSFLLLLELTLIQPLNSLWCYLPGWNGLLRSTDYQAQHHVEGNLYSKVMRRQMEPIDKS